MKFDDLKNLLLEELDIDRYADIARELGVTPQVVNNWKSRGHVPYKYVKIANSKIELKKKSEVIGSIDQNLPPYVVTGVQSSINSDDDEDSIIYIAIELFKIFKAKYIYILITALVFGLGSIIFDRYFAEPVYLSVCKLLPKSENSSSGGLGGFASSFGINLGSKNGHSLYSSSMFPNVLRSRKLMRDMLLENFYSEKDDTSKILLSILLDRDIAVENISDGLIKHGIGILKGKIRISDLKNSPLMTISVLTNSPRLSSDLLVRLLDRFNNLMLDFKLSQIIDQKNFISNRITEINRDLVKAEENLKTFRDRNRFIASSPALLLEEDRLDREVLVQTEIYINLKNQLEMVKIEKVKQGLLFQVLDEPESVGKLSPKPLKNFIQRIVLGIILSISIILIFNWYEKNKNIFF
jgi:capsular polysaccharide biosynthesis protein